MSGENGKLEESQLPRIALIASVIFGVCYLFLFPDLWLYVIGGMHFTDPAYYPFLDMHGRLAAFEGHRSGIDILYNPNPFDPFQRVSVKPTWPLALTFLGLGPQHLIAAGTAAAVGLGAIVFSILKPRRWIEMLVLLPICFSPPILLGIERGNDDIVYLILLALVPLVLKLKLSVRFWLAWLVIFMLAPAKYYPGAVFGIFFLEVKNWRQLGLLFGAGVLFVTAYFCSHMDEVLYLKEAVPKPNFFLVHGASLTFEAINVQAYWGALLSLLCVITGAVIVFIPRWLTLNLEIGLQRWYLLGYAVFAFCFFFNSNFDYRLIYLLLMLPLLFQLVRMPVFCKGPVSMVRIMVLLLIPAFWAEIVGMHYFIIQESWTIELVRFAVYLKSAMLWIFLFGSTVIAATLLRPNLRSLAADFYTDCKQFRLK